MIEWLFGIGACSVGLTILGCAVFAVLNEWRITIRSTAHSKGYGEGREETERYIRNEAINRGLAFYHPQTGLFTWNPAQPKPEINANPPVKKAAKK